MDISTIFDPGPEVAHAATEYPREVYKLYTSAQHLEYIKFCGAAQMHQWTDYF